MWVKASMDCLFLFVCSSASQLREQKSFFIYMKTWEDVITLRKKIIPQPEVFDNSAKYLSRLGLFGTSDISAGFLSRDLFEEIDDLRARNGRIVTDGAGYIQESLARKLFKKAEISVNPSPFQFRYGGMKGVLVILPDDHKEFQNKSGKILYRKSQVKFETDHTEIGIVKVAKIHDLYLNRESITLLESMFLTHTGMQDIWNFPSTLVKNQDQYLDQTAEMLENQGAAKKELTKHMSSALITKVSESFDLVSEPCFFRLLRCSYKITVSDLCKRANLRIEDGCYVMGIPDYSGKLEHNQVFLKTCKEGEPSKLILGPVIIYRNPCLHPGDIRRVEAVDIPELHDSMNVIILPAEKSEYSLAESCSGGDLDGDNFSVIWDKAYIPPHKQCIEPLKYYELGGSKPTQSQNATSSEELADFFVNCMRNEALGRIAHIHLALSDYKETGAMDPLCMALAESQAIAVDFPKTGISPVVPKEALEIMRKEGYPDFMEKNSDFYVSKKVLGDLYRSCKSFLFAYDLEEALNRKIPFDQAMALEISPAIIKKAEEVYSYYIIQMRRLMNQFSLQQEEEVLLGRAVVWHKLLNSDRDKASQQLQNAYEALKTRFLRIFTDMAPQGKVLEWAAAWYKVAYDQNKEFKNRPFLSFPWIVYEWLCQLKGRNHTSPQCTHVNIEIQLGRSSVETLLEATSFHKFDVNLLREKLVEKQLSLDKIKGKLSESYGEDFFDMRPYGSCSILLCEEDSDLDIGLIIKPMALQHTNVGDKLKTLSKEYEARHFLRNYLLTVVDEICSEKTDLTDNNVPLIKGKMEGQSIDITCNYKGLLKTSYILTLYFHDIAYFVTFWTLIRWARFYGLIKFAGMELDGHLIDTATMYAIIIHLLQTPKYDEMQHQPYLDHLTMPELLDEVKLKLLSEVNKDDDVHKRIGGYIHKFFRHGQMLTEDNVILEWPLEGLDKAVLAAQDVSSIRRACIRGLHMILYSRDIGELINNAKDCTAKDAVAVKKLPLSLSKVLLPGRQFHEKRLMAKSKAKITLSKEIGEDRLIFRAEGPRRAIADALNELLVLHKNVKAFTIGIPAKKSSKYFMVGSTLMMVRNSGKVNCKVSFSDSQGSYHLAHMAHQRSTPVLMYSQPVEEDEWIHKQCVPELVKKLSSQVNELPLAKEEIQNSLEISTRFGTAYAIDIDNRLPETQTTLSMEEMMSCIELKKSMRSTVERMEYDTKRKICHQSGEEVIGPGNIRKSFVETTRKKLKNQRIKNKAISVSFRSGVLNPDFGKKELDDIKGCEEVYIKTLMELGFEPGFCEMERIGLDQYWVIPITVTSGKKTILFNNIKTIQNKNKR